MANFLKNELKKFRHQNITKVIVLLALIIPAADALLCLNQHLSYKNLAGLNILFGIFLVMPCLFIMLLVALFQTEEQNDTLKNILLTNISKWRILLVKIVTSFVLSVLFMVLIWFVGIFCGYIVGGRIYPVKGLVATLLSGIAAILASCPIIIVVIVSKKNFLLSLIFSNCILIVDFLATWQLTMLNGLNVYLPICIAMRVTYPFQVIEYSPILQHGMDALYFPPLTGWLILVSVAGLSLGLSLLIYEKQEV